MVFILFCAHSVSCRIIGTSDLPELMALIEKGKIRPVIAEGFPFDKISEAHLLAEQRGQIGKIVVILPD